MLKINFSILSDKHVYTIFVGKPWRQNGNKDNPFIFFHSKLFITITNNKHVYYQLNENWKLNKKLILSRFKDWLSNVDAGAK